MVLLVLTRGGYEDVRHLVETKAGPVWLNADVLAAPEVAALRGSGVDVSCFTERIDPTSRVQLEGAVATIQEHHPRQTLWVETPHEVSAT